VAPRSVLASWDQLPLDKVTEMVSRKVITGRDLVITQAYFKRGVIVPVHVDPFEAALYVLQGALRAQVAGDAMTVHEGDVLLIPAGAVRQAEAVDDTFLMIVATRRDGDG
jgi:quercetin dioxygenase-like cupin family protein